VAKSIISVLELVQARRMPCVAGVPHQEWRGSITNEGDDMDKVTRRGAGTRLLALAGGLTLGLDAHAQSAYKPTAPVQLVVGFIAGGVTDVVARIMSEEMQKEFGQAFVVMNRPGAAGILGANFVAKAPPNGQTLLFIPSTHTAHPALHKAMPYDTLEDFTAINLLVTAPNLLVVRADAPWKNLAEFVADAKRRPDGIQWASSGIGVSTHLGGEQFQYLAGIKLYHVPYKSSTEPVRALLAGEVAASISALNAALPFVKTGKLRVLGVASEKRSKFLPDSPTFEEQGYKGMRSETWIGVVGPAKMPPAMVSALNQFFRKTLARPDVLERIATAGAEPVGTEGEAFQQQIRHEVELNKQLVQLAGIKAE
jgi:tripartite-type tricarboxylate transporter receptor subunit TctC